MKKDIFTEILPRALWIIMAFCLFLGQYFTNQLVLTKNIYLIYSGFLIAILGGLMWLYVGYYMGKSLFNKKLIITGPFKYIRHPMYTGIYIMLTGIGILFSSKIWFIIMIIFIPIFYINCKIEENQMIKIHGKKYINYQKKTGMFFPYLIR